MAKNQDTGDGVHSRVLGSQEVGIERGGWTEPQHRAQNDGGDGLQADTGMVSGSNACYRLARRPDAGSLMPAPSRDPRCGGSSSNIATVGRRPRDAAVCTSAPGLPCHWLFSITRPCPEHLGSAPICSSCPLPAPPPWLRQLSQCSTISPSMPPREQVKPLATCRRSPSLRLRPPSRHQI